MLFFILSKYFVVDPVKFIEKSHSLVYVCVRVCVCVCVRVCVCKLTVPFR